MASAHKKDGSPFWYVFYRNADGRRVSKSTGLLVKETSRAKAEKIGEELERAASKARQGTLTADRARDCLSEIYQIASGGRLLFTSVEDHFRDWLKNKGASRKRATFDSYRVVVNGFLEHLGARKRMSLEQLTPGDVLAYRDGLLRAGKSPQTANSYVKILRLPLTVARKHNLIPSNPAEAVDSLPSDATERGTFTLEQVKQLLAAATEAGEREWVGMILLGFYTGQRISDLANLRGENLELHVATPHLALTQGKTKRRVVVPLAPAAVEWLLAQPASDDPKAPLFPSLSGKGTGGVAGLSARFDRIMKKAGLDRGLARGAKGGRKLAKLSFHCLRHTFNSTLANEGVAQEVRQRLTGHASAEVNTRYTHLELGSLRSAVDVLPDVRPER